MNPIGMCHHNSIQYLAGDRNIEKGVKAKKKTNCFGETLRKAKISATIFL